jgi:DNA invertase Pin-like site-specific DNA recombinase
MLTVLGGLAQFERELIRARASEGRARAVANGVKLGRKPKLTPHQQQEASQRVADAATTFTTARFHGSRHDGWFSDRPCDNIQEG